MPRKGKPGADTRVIKAVAPLVLANAFKARAALENRTIQDVLISLIEQYVKTKKEAAR